MQRYYSNIYWHFTGSPKDINWSKITMPKEILKQGELKSDKEAVNSIKDIIESKTLKATSQEMIENGIETQKFCCVCDIPFKDLITHSKYYGKAAIGFKSKAIHPKFNPVIYLDKQKLLTKIEPEIDVTTYGGLIKKSDSFGSIILKLLLFSDQINKKFSREVNEVLGVLKDYIKITKFSDKDQETFYREREWRYHKDFTFEIKDISGILVPEKYIHEIKKMFQDVKVSIISFEFLDNA